MVAGYYKRGRQPSDEMFSEVLERMGEPLLPEHEMSRVGALLKGQRGRVPKDASTREQLARWIGGSNRHDVPRSFLSALADRLDSGKRFTEVERNKRFQIRHDRRTRDHLICTLYDQFWKLQDGKNFVIHPVFGRIEGPETGCTRSERALFMTHTVIDESLEMFAPSVRTILNIVTKNN